LIGPATPAPVREQSGLIFRGVSPHVQRVLVVQKRAVRILAKAHFREHCKPLFVKLKILTVPCLLLLEACCFVINNPDLFPKNNSIHDHNTRASKQVHVEGTALSLSMKGPRYACTRIYNHLEPFISKFIPIDRNPRSILKSLLLDYPFYNIKEFFDTPVNVFINNFKL